MCCHGLLGENRKVGSNFLPSGVFVCQIISNNYQIENFVSLDGGEREIFRAIKKRLMSPVASEKNDDQESFR